MIIYDLIMSIYLYNLKLSQYIYMTYYNKIKKNRHKKYEIITKVFYITFFYGKTGDTKSVNELRFFWILQS